jgi:hypothetical protein
MPLLFIGTGIVFILTGLNGDAAQLWAQLKTDFSGSGSFLYWLLSICTLGVLGYIPELKNLSRLFIVLVLLVLLLDNGGFFSQLQAFINSDSNSSSTNSTSATTGS